MQLRAGWLLAAVCVALGCGNPVPEAVEKSRAAPRTVAAVVAESPPVQPPFEVRDEAAGLLLVWYDADGAAHSAATRSQIPEDRRAQVRVDSLTVPPEARLDPAYVYLADLSKPDAQGAYPVRKVLRDPLEAALSKPAPSNAGNQEGVAKAGSDVIVYGASWCGFCRQAKSYLQQKGVPFIEKDIEKEPGARSEMLAKAQAQGVRTSGIPVIDVYGTILPGFDRERLDVLLARK